MRIESSAVAAVVSHLPAGADVTSFIQAAEAIVDREILNQGYTETELALIETFLAAHLVCLDRPSRTSDSGTGVSVSYNKPPSGNGLEATPHGRMVMLLDKTGKLAASAMTGPAVVFSVVENE
jgi:hypothetical protein